MTNLTDRERTGPPLRVAWGNGAAIQNAFLNSFAEARIAQAILFEHVSTTAEVWIQEGDGYTRWTSEDGRSLAELTGAEARDLDYAWEHRALGTAVTRENARINEAEEMARRVATA